MGAHKGPLPIFKGREMRDVISPPAVIGEAIAGRSVYVRKQLSSLAHDLKKHTFDMAELLEEAKRGSLYTVWGYGSLAEYGMAELNLKHRKTQYLVRIVEVCNSLGIKREVYEKAGISKLREITSLDPSGYYVNESKEAEPLAKHMAEMILNPDEHTVEEISYNVFKLKGLDAEDRAVVRSFQVNNAAWEKTIKPAFELARRKLGSAGRDEEGNAREYPDGVCLEMICADFNADPNHYDGVFSDLDSVEMDRLEEEGRDRERPKLEDEIAF
jgi:hypothetical protein